MLNENALLWVQALESGEYEKGMFCLKRHLPLRLLWTTQSVPEAEAATDTSGPTGALYCCLGVACELYIAAHPDHVEAKWTPRDDAQVTVEPTIQYSLLGTSQYLPEPVAQWLGLRTVSGAYQEPGDTPELTNQTSLVLKNDSRVNTFLDIARIIRSEPTDLFDPPEIQARNKAIRAQNAEKVRAQSAAAWRQKNTEGTD